MNQQPAITDDLNESLLRHALELESIKTVALGVIRSKISTLNLGVGEHPEMEGLRSDAQGLERDLKALRAFQADHPCYRLEKAGGLLGNFA